MENKIEIGDKLDLEKIEKRLSVNPDKGPEVYTSQVLDEGESGNLMVAMPIREGNVIPLGVGQEFFATFYTKNGLFRCRVAVVGRYKKDSLFLLQIEQRTALQKMQRREYFRFECRIPIEYRLLGEEERQKVERGEAYVPTDEKLSWKNATMLDLSGGGIRFITTVLEDKESFIEVRFPITFKGKSEMIYAYARLLRAQRNENNNTIFDHHIKFWYMNKDQREKIIRYIFDEQRKNRAKQLG